MMDLQFTKICFKCGNQKEKKHFYKHPQTKDGYLGKCKECTKKDSSLDLIKKTSTIEGLEKERARHRDKYYRLEYKEKHKPCAEKRKEYNEKYINLHPEKAIVRNKTSHLKPIVKGNHLHHWNYNIDYAKDTIELSKSDHYKVHRFIKYDKKTFMYKDLNGILLDTKEKHFQYVNKVIKNF